MEHTDLEAIGLGAVALGTLLYGIAFNLVSLVGFGAVLSFGFNLFRYQNERRENARRKTNDAIQRFLPTIYQPLFSWSVKTKQFLEQALDSNWSVPGHPPDFTENAEFNSLIGSELHNSYDKLLSLSKHLNENYEKMRAEYRQRVDTLVKLRRSEWRLGDVTIVVGNTQHGLDSLIVNNPLSKIRETVHGASSYSMTTGGSDVVPCPPELITALEDARDLPSWQAYENSWKALKQENSNFLARLMEIMRKGEKDWLL